MRKIKGIIALTFSLAIILNSVFAQNSHDLAKRKEIDISSNQLTLNNVSYVNYSTVNENIVLTFLDSTKLHVVTLNTNLEKTKDSLTYLLPTEGYSMQQTIVTKNAIDYLVRNNKGNLSILKYNFKTKQWIFGNNLVKDNERYLFSIVFQNKIYLFNYDKNARSIKSYTATNGLLFKEFSVADFKLGEHNLDYFLKKKRKPLKVIDVSSPVELFASIKHKKVYQFAEKINLIMEDSISNTVGLLQLNLKSKKQSFHTYTAEKTSCEKPLFINSALTKNYLTLFSGCLAEARLTIWSLKTNKPIKSSTINKNELIKIKNYDNLISPKHALSIERLKPIVLLQRFSAKNSAIFTKEYSDNLEIIVGYSNVKNKKKFKKKGNGGGNGNGGGKGTGGGKQRKIQKMKQRMIKGYGLSKSYLNYETTRPQYFVAKLNLKNNNFDTNSTFINPFTKIKNVKLSLNKKILPGNQLILNLNTIFWYAYIDIIKQKMIFLKVD